MWCRWCSFRQKGCRPKAASVWLEAIVGGNPEVTPRILVVVVVLSRPAVVASATAAAAHPFVTGEILVEQVVHSPVNGEVVIHLVGCTQVEDLVVLVIGLFAVDLAAIALG